MVDGSGVHYLFSRIGLRNENIVKHESISKHITHVETVPFNESLASVNTDKSIRFSPDGAELLYTFRVIHKAKQ